MSRDIYYVKRKDSRRVIRIDDALATVEHAAVTLAGLEVALAAALREAGRGKCLKCGGSSLRPESTHGWEPADIAHCDRLVLRNGELEACGGILSPTPTAGKVE